METTEKKQLIDEFKDQWRSMWRNRLDDKVRAEGIADKDYSLLFVDRGTVIIATRKFKLLDFRQILQQSGLSSIGEIVPLDPSVGGWRKFAKTFFSSQNPARRERLVPKPDKYLGQQIKKGGRGWLHVRK